MSGPPRKRRTAPIGDRPRSPAPAVPVNEAIWLGSFVTLGAVDVISLGSLSPRLLSTLGVLGIAGGAGLVATSAHDLRHAVDPYLEIDAASDIAWGVQGLLYLSRSAAAQAASVVLGLAGAAAQTSVGVLRIRRGLRSSQAAEVKLGVLDLGGGLLWLGWDLIGWSQPIFIGTYVVLMVGREAYANKRLATALGGTLAEEAQRALTDVASGAGAVCREAADLVVGVRGAAARLRDLLRPGPASGRLPRPGT